MKFSKIIIFVLLLLISFNSFAQKKKKKTKKAPKNIELIETKFSFTPIYVKEYSYLHIKSREHDGASNLKYKPNIIGSVGGKITIKNFTLSYVHALPQPKEFGKTKASNFIFNLQKRTFGLQMFWIRYNGLYLDTLDRYGIFDDMKKQGIDNAFILRPDMKLNNIGFQTNFITNKQYSLNAAFEQTERQKKSMGAFMILTGLNFKSISTNKFNSLIIKSQQQFFPLTSNLSKLRTISFKPAPGMGYSFIIKKYFSISGMLHAGPNFQLKWFKLDNEIFTRFRPWLSFYYGAKMAIGYNGKHFMANIVYSRSEDIIGFRKYYKSPILDCKTNFKYYREFLKLSIGFRIY